MLIKLHIKSDRQNTGLVPLTFPPFYSFGVPTLAGGALLGCCCGGRGAGTGIRVLLLLILRLLVLLRGSGDRGCRLLLLLLPLGVVLQLSSLALFYAIVCLLIVRAAAVSALEKAVETLWEDVVLAHAGVETCGRVIGARMAVMVMVVAVHTLVLHKHFCHGGWWKTVPMHQVLSRVARCVIAPVVPFAARVQAV